MDPMEWLFKNRYGSLELSRQMGPNLLRGLFGSAMLHGLVVATFMVMALLNGGQPVKITAPHPPIEIDSFRPIRPLPPVVRDLEKPAPANPAAKPIPVPAEPPEDPMASSTPAKPGIPGPIDIPGTGIGDLPPDTGPVVIGEPGEGIPIYGTFVPHEFEPTPLSINPQPEYPELARLSGMTGKVTVRMWVDAHGKVLQWEIVQANPEGFGFEDEVGKVLPKWRFTPALQQGRPVGVWISVPFKFTYEK